MYIDAAGTWDSTSGVAAPNVPYTVTANHTMAANDSMVLGDASGGAITITLPTSPTPGLPYAVMKSDASANAVAVATGAGTIHGPTSITTQNSAVWYVWDGTNWDQGPQGPTGPTGPQGPSGAGAALLELFRYAPATMANYSITAVGTLAPVDATNISPSVTAPASGNIFARITAIAASAGSSNPLVLGLLDHTTGAIHGDSSYAVQGTNAVPTSVPIEITSLTPGTTYQMDLAACNGATGTANIYAQAGGKTISSPALGPLIIEFWSA